MHGVRTTSAEEGGAPQGLIASRLRQTASAAAPSHFEPMTPISVEQWLRDDAGHLHRAFDLTRIPVTSDRRLGARPGLVLSEFESSSRTLVCGGP
jgi:hypothetical protein